MALMLLPRDRRPAVALAYNTLTPLPATRALICRALFPVKYLNLTSLMLNGDGLLHYCLPYGHDEVLQALLSKAWHNFRTVTTPPTPGSPPPHTHSLARTFTIHSWIVGPPLKGLSDCQHSSTVHWMPICSRPLVPEICKPGI